MVSAVDFYLCYAFCGFSILATRIMLHIWSGTFGGSWRNICNIAFPLLSTAFCDCLPESRRLSARLWGSFRAIQQCAKELAQAPASVFHLEWLLSYLPGPDFRGCSDYLPLSPWMDNKETNLRATKTESSVKQTKTAETRMATKTMTGISAI